MAEREACHNGAELRGFHRFRHVSLESGAQGTCPILRPRKCRQGRRGYVSALVWRERANPPNELIPVLSGHANVTHDDIGDFLRENRESFVARPGKEDAGSAIFEDAAKEIARVRIIVDGKHGDAFQGRPIHELTGK